MLPGPRSHHQDRQPSPCFLSVIATHGQANPPRKMLLSLLPRPAPYECPQHVCRRFCWVRDGAKYFDTIPEVNPPGKELFCSHMIQDNSAQEHPDCHRTWAGIAVCDEQCDPEGGDPVREEEEGSDDVACTGSPVQFARHVLPIDHAGKRHARCHPRLQLRSGRRDIDRRDSLSLRLLKTLPRILSRCPNHRLIV